MTAPVPSACDADCSRSGVDEVDVSDPRKVWRCDGCGAEGTSHQLDAAHRAPVPSGPLSDEAVAALVCHAYETIGPRYEALALALMKHRTWAVRPPACPVTTRAGWTSSPPVCGISNASWERDR